MRACVRACACVRVSYLSVVETFHDKALHKFTFTLFTLLTYCVCARVVCVYVNQGTINHS